MEETTDTKGSEDKKEEELEAKRNVPENKPNNNIVKDIIKKDPFIRYGIYAIIILAIVILITNVNLPSWPGGEDSAGYEGEQVKLDFYVMSQCPYGTQVEDAIAPVLKKLGNAIDFNLEFIATDLGGGQFRSLHGEPEVQGNIAQLCAREHSPKEYMAMIVCMNKNAGAIPGNWEACAKEAKCDAEKIKACLVGEEGKGLLLESLKKAEAVQATGSPTIYINDQPYQGARDSLSFQRALCQKLDNHPECANMPECATDEDCTGEPGKVGLCKEEICFYQDPVEVEVIVLNAKECSSCDTSQILSITQQLFLGAKSREVDVSTEEGKELAEKYGITVVPAYIFDSKVTETYSWKNNVQLQGSFEKIGEEYKIIDEATGAAYFISEEARQAYYDAIGLTAGDNKPQIDFFVMSYCPYGNIAEEAAFEAYKVLGDKAEFIPHYVIYENYGGGGPDYCMGNGNYCSMHGIQELNQNIREYCAYKYDGIKEWFDFAIAMNSKCTYQNADSCWEAVAEGLGLDTAQIKKCEKEEGLDIVKADKELNDILKVSGSPTVFIEGDAYNGARSGEGYKAGLCAKFDEAPTECATVIESTGDAVPEGSC